MSDTLQHTADAHRVQMAVIIPTYGQLRYADAAVRSLIAGSADMTIGIVVVDDASPDWSTDWLDALPDSPNTRLTWIRLEKNSGLTAAWNAGFRIALSMFPFARLIVAGNSDLLFPYGWWSGLIGAAHELDIVGPLTNAPGTTIGCLQNIADHLPGYTVSDKLDDLDEAQADLLTRYGVRAIRECPFNGFCMAARPSVWLKHAHCPDNKLIFPQSIDVMPSGRTNPTPLLTGQESWLHHRVKQAGCRTGAALGSFVFHYRSVTRGERHLSPGWARMTGEGA